MAVAVGPVRLVLAGACGLLLLGGVAGAVVVDEDDGGSAPTGALAPGDSTTTSAGVAGDPAAPAPAGAEGAVATPTTVVGGAPGTSAPGAAAAASTTTTTARAGRAAAPGPLVPPKAGDYVYESTSTPAAGPPRTNRTTTKVEAAGAEGNTTLQAVTIDLDFGGQRATARNTVAWNGGATVRRSIITVPALNNQQLDCVWQPAFLQYSGGLAVGKTWSYSTRCAGKIGGIDVAIDQKATRKVTGAATFAGPAGAVATWTIADDTTLTLTSPLGAGTVRTVGTQSLAPSLGVPVSSDSRVEASMAGQPPERSTATTKLVALP